MYTKYSLNNFYSFALSILIISLLFAGGYGLTGYAAEKLAIVSAMTVIGKIVLRTVKINKYNRVFICLFFIIMLYLSYNYLHSYSRSFSRPYLLRFAFAFILLFYYYDVKMLHKILKYSRKVMLAIALIYIVCYPFFGRDTGVYHSYQNTALNVSLALGLFIPDLFNRKNLSWKTVASFFLLVATIGITGKRTFFAIPIFMVFIVALLSNDNKKHKKILTLLIVLGGAFLVTSLVFPQISLSLKRIINSQSDSTLNYRLYFWQYAIDVWEQNKFFGIGLGTFSLYIATSGINLAKYGYIQAYDAHNIYYQMLAELGLVGFILMCTFFILCALKSIKVVLKVRRSDNKELIYLSNVAMYFIFWFLISGITGNPLYMPGQLFALFFGVSIDITLLSQLKENKNRSIVE